MSNLEKENTKISKFLSLILRHKPETIGLSLDEQGFANIDELINKTNKLGDIGKLDRTLLQHIVDTNDKKRFIISSDKKQIRANQGHSIDVDLQLSPVKPPEFLYHGTATRFLDSILKEGLKPQSRQHVHLSQDKQTATKVGKRHGKPTILKIKTQVMNKEGFCFYQSQNGVWLTNHVPVEFIVKE